MMLERQLANNSKLGKFIFRKAIFDKPNQQKKVFLTFDDGPTPIVTEWVLDELKKNDFKACFFCVGSQIKKFPEIYERILREGHQVGNHTFNHLNAWKTDNEKYLDDVNQASKLINSTFFRPPYGKLNPFLAKELNKEYQIILWSGMFFDWESKVSLNQSKQLVKKHTECGNILVFHDSEKSFSKLKELLPYCLETMRERGLKTGKL